MRPPRQPLPRLKEVAGRGGAIVLTRRGCDKRSPAEAAKMDADPQELLEQGFVILRRAVSGGELARMRESCERLLDRQKETWRRERQPGDPPGGEWELAGQPRVSIDKVVDESTAHVVDFCLGETTMGVSRRLMGAPVACPGMLAMLCSPPVGMGRTRWHRDITPPSLAPLCGLQQDMLANGPALLQWNVALYDDDVLWVVPGSHRRRNTGAENAQWRFRRLGADAGKHPGRARGRRRRRLQQHDPALGQQLHSPAAPHPPPRVPLLRKPHLPLLRRARLGPRVRRPALPGVAEAVRALR